MATATTLREVWASNWGEPVEMADPRSILDEQVDVTRPPALWPKPDQDNIMIAPVHNAGQWFTLIKVNQAPGLSERQKQALQVLGFKEGDAGRWIQPSYPHPSVVYNLSRILGAPLEPLDGTEIISLKGDFEFAPVVPQEVQSGIRWYWKNAPDTLIEEVLATLTTYDGELPERFQALLDGCPVHENGQRIPSRAFANLTRLQAWVADALSGEVNEITEAILHLGLLKGAARYGATPGDWPDYLLSVYRGLQALRGEATPVIESSEMPDTSLTEVERRPDIGKRVSWLADNTRITGSVVSHDESRDHLWVTSEQAPGAATDLDFLHFPLRQRIRVDDILGEKAEPAVVATPAPEAAPTSVAESSQAMTADAPDSAVVTPEQEQEQEIDRSAYKSQPDVTVQDIKSERDQTLFETRNPVIPAKVEAKILSALATGNMKTEHPLLLGVNAPLNLLIERWGAMGEEIYHLHDVDGARRDILQLVRDELLNQFNACQPPTLNGTRSALAVLPAPHGIERLLLQNDPEAMDLISKLTPFRVGIHPTLRNEVLERLIEWEDRTDASSGISPRLKSSLDSYRISMLNSSGTLAGCAFGVGDQRLNKLMKSEFDASLVRMSVEGETSYKNMIAALSDLTSAEKIQEIQEACQGHVFMSLIDAHRHLEGSGAHYSAIAKGNQQRLTALAELSDKGLQDIESLEHPLFIVIDTLMEHGLDAKNRAEALALLNIDLSTRMDVLGQLAELSGLKVDALLTHTIRETPDADTQERLLKLQSALGHGIDLVKRGVDRATIYTGMLANTEGSRPFQAIVYARSETLFEDAIRRGQGQRFDFLDNLMSAETGKHGRFNRYSEGVGRLVDMHTMTPLSLGDAVTQEQQILTTESLERIKPIVLSISDPMEIAATPIHERLGFNVMPTAQLEATLPSVIGSTQGPSIARQAAEQLKPLQAMAPAWRSDPDQVDKIKEAFALCFMDAKGLEKWSKKRELALEFARSFVESRVDGQMMVFGFKVTQRGSRKQVLHQQRTLSSSDIAAAGGDRDLAAQRAILAIKSRSPETRKGYHFTIFDAAKVLRPEALRYLKEEREALRRQLTGDETAEPGRRGKRQDKGLVAGLAIKDLRGKSAFVLDTLDSASPEDQERFITKTKLWPAPDWTYLRSPSEEDMNDGARAMQPIVAAFFDELRTRLIGAPPANDPAINKVYAKLVLGIRDAFDRLRTKDELTDALSNQDGMLRELYDEIKEQAHGLGAPTEVLFGQGVISDHYWKKVQPFESVFSKASRRSLNNQHWDIKDRKGSYRPTNEAGEDKPKSGAMPMLEKLVRTGAKDYRAGLSVSEQTMIETFGFSGIEYGNSMTQADREMYLSEAYDGFMDLATVLKVPPRALSLGGTLGLAFGSRGTGGRRAALAHFEPGNNVINLTRMKGAGSMAHEFGHALANYLFRVSRGIPGSRAPGDITTSIDQQINGRFKEINGGNLRQVVTDAVAGVLKAIRYTPLSDAERPQDSEFIRGARRADAEDGRKRDNLYWSTVEELFARSFETFVNFGLKAQHPDYRNDFLVRPDKLKVWGTDIAKAREEAGKAEERLQNVDLKLALKGDETPEQVEQVTREAKANLQEQIHAMRRRTQLYPATNELAAISKAYNTLFEVLETKEQEVRHDHLGTIKLPILYSHSTSSIARIGQREHEIVAQCVLDEVARMCGPDVWVSWHKSLKDNQQRPVAGQYREFMGADNKLQTVIDLALGASMNTAHHEAFHFAQNHLLTKNERVMMDMQFAPDSTLNGRVVASLLADGDTEAAYMAATDTREAQAYGYEQWVRGKLDVKDSEPPQTVFGRIKAFFGRVTGIAHNAGFSDPHSLFSAFHHGKMRERAEQGLTQTVSAKANTPSAPQYPNDTRRPNVEPFGAPTKQYSSHRTTNDHEATGATSERANRPVQPMTRAQATRVQVNEESEPDAGPHFG